MRILVVIDVPPLKELGSAQMAINLTEALQAQGHEVTLWTPYPMPARTRWWQGIQNILFMRSKLDEFLQTQKPFDMIDSCPLMITNRLSKSGVVVCRSVQPEILYIVSNLNAKQQKSIKDLLLTPFSYIFSLVHIFFLLQGWARAKYIFCLGSLDFEWMKKWFPWWKNKLIVYLNALSKTEQTELARIRLSRKQLQKTEKGIKFLWIGRWNHHKGISTLRDFIVKRVASHPQDSFTIAGCGSGAEKDFSLELIQSNRVKILPSFTRNELYSLLNNHDVGLFTSKVEGWGLVLNEMLESGMLIFATSTGGVADLKKFFPEMILSFPPPPEYTKNNLKSFEVQEEYYQLFSWSKIAENYSKLLL